MVTVVGEAQLVEMTFVRVGEGVVVWNVAVRGDAIGFVFIDECFGLEDRHCDLLSKVGGWCFSAGKARCL